jgi:hypothetical protein
MDYNRIERSKFMQIIRGENIVELFADEGKDLIKIDENSEMRAKRVALPIDAALWEEVDELPIESIQGEG